MPAHTHEQKSQGSDQRSSTLAGERAFSVRSALLAFGLAILLALMTGLSVKTGPYLDKYKERNPEARSLSVDAGPLAQRALNGAPALCVKVDASKPYTPTPAEISQLPATEGINTFSFNPNTLFEPELSAEDEQAITEALGYFTSRGLTCSCMIVDLTTGHGIGFDYEKRVYGASAFKGIVSAYICEELIDGGSHELDGALQQLIKETVVRSNNDTYRSLRVNYTAQMQDWVTEMDVDPSYVMLYRFPTYNAQESTALWAHVAEYLDGGSETAAWLGDLFASTNVSHIRVAVERGLEDGSLVAEGDVLVQNKAGWIAARVNSTTDAGLVRMNGRTYAISVMSNAPDCDESREANSEVALALLAAMQ